MDRAEGCESPIQDESPPRPAGFSFGAASRNLRKKWEERMSGPKDQALRQRAKAVIPNGMY
ncbi:MAG: hypothetical protein AAFR33_15865, partial [Pseudomonadota bacterium]